MSPSTWAERPEFDSSALLVASPFFLSELDLAHWKDALERADKPIARFIQLSIRLRHNTWIHKQISLALLQIDNVSDALRRIESRGGLEALDELEQLQEDQEIEIDKDHITHRISQITQQGAKVNLRLIVDLLNHLDYISHVASWFVTGRIGAPPRMPPAFDDVDPPSIDAPPPPSLSDDEVASSIARSAPEIVSPTPRPTSRRNWSRRYKH